MEKRGHGRRFLLNQALELGEKILAIAKQGELDEAILLQSQQTQILEKALSTATSSVDPKWVAEALTRIDALNRQSLDELSAQRGEVEKALRELKSVEKLRKTYR